VGVNENIAGVYKSESVVCIVLALGGFVLTVIGWATDWRGYVQGFGGGICWITLVWSLFAVYRVSKASKLPNNERGRG